VTRYQISGDAKADLDGIWNYIADRAGAETASQFIWKFDQTFASIAASPRAGVNSPDLPPGDVRRFPMGNYLIYYRVLSGKILISRVLHGKRAPGRAFRQKP
jgi:toxin ParE1/3/4